MNPSTHSPGVSRWIIWSLGSILLCLTVLTLTFLFLRWDASRKRMSWGCSAIAQLGNTNDQGHPSLDFPEREPGEWVTDTMLLMTNGQTLTYRFRHGTELIVPHLFIARDSNGRWWYSSFHFCNGMSMIRWEDPPGSISEFAHRFSLRQFDPLTHDWAEPTWSP